MGTLAAINNLITEWLRTVNEVNFQKFADDLKGFSEQHPVITIFLGICATLFMIPVVIFICVVIFTLLFTIIGFVLIEGTILTASSIVLSFVLVILAIVGAFFSVLVVAGWYTLSAAYKTAFRNSDLVISSSADGINNIQSNAHQS